MTAPERSMSDWVICPFGVWELPPGRRAKLHTGRKAILAARGGEE